MLDTPESLEMLSAFDVCMETTVCSKPLSPIQPKENS